MLTHMILQAPWLSAEGDDIAAGPSGAHTIPLPDLVAAEAGRSGRQPQPPGAASQHAWSPEDRPAGWSPAAVPGTQPEEEDFSHLPAPALEVQVS